MTVLVTDAGFGADDWRPDPIHTLNLTADTDPETLRSTLDALQMIRVEFANFADGRGFTIARQLRLMGYRGRLRAHGQLIADQYAMARRAGFDEVEISDELAARQGHEQWRARANWRQHDYQSRLRAKV